jgi:arabinose-5-phosphate isomerase
MKPETTPFTHEQIIDFGRKAIQDELDDINNLPRYLNDDFALAVMRILQSSGRIVITGIGKSALIGQKIVASMNSTGQPALFMHAADATHGDLGMIQDHDIIIAISKSGNTAEMLTLLPLLRQLNNPLIAIVGNLHSKLAQQADFVLNTTITKEACPNNLAPTTSTTAQLLMGDALTVALLRLRNFSDKDFSKYHPGGALGKQLYLKCGEIAQEHGKPMVPPNTSWKDVIINITENRLGATVVIDHETILGIITDGDVRRMLGNHENLQGLSALNIMSPNPISVPENTLAVKAAQLMQQNKISQLIVTENNVYKGLIHLHDLYQHGIIN